jgi:hypothetical protein
MSQNRGKDNQMKTGIKNKQVYHSVEEFRRKFLPGAGVEKPIESSEEAKALGISMARDSISKIDIKLKK